jgi:hypothetical protein
MALVARIDPLKLLVCPAHAASRRHKTPEGYTAHLKLRVTGWRQLELFGPDDELHF